MTHLSSTSLSSFSKKGGEVIFKSPSVEHSPTGLTAWILYLPVSIGKGSLKITWYKFSLSFCLKTISCKKKKRITVKVLLITLVIEDRALQLSKVGRKVYLGLFDFLSILKPLDVRNGESMNLALKDKLLVMLSLRIFQWNLHGWWH